jgi:hypothetical protein
MTTTQVPFDKLIAVRLVYKKTNASRRNTKQALLSHIEKGELPPESISSFGGTATVSRDLLKTQDRIEKALRSALQRVAVQEEDLGVYLTTEAAFETVKDEIAVLINEHKKWKEDFIAAYDTANEELAISNPKFADLIRGRKFTKSYFDKQLKAGYKVVRLNSADIGENEEHKVSSSSLFDRLMEEASKFATELWEESFKGRKCADRRILRPIKTLQAKLHALSVIDIRVQNVIDVMEETLSKIPEKGNLTDRDFTLLNSLVLNVANPMTLEKIASGGFVVPAVTLAASVELDFQPEETTPEANSAPAYVMPVITEDTEADLFASIW